MQIKLSDQICWRNYLKNFFFYENLFPCVDTLNSFSDAQMHIQIASSSSHRNFKCSRHCAIPTNLVLLRTFGYQELREFLFFHPWGAWLSSIFTRRTDFPHKETQTQKLTNYSIHIISFQFTYCAKLSN